jgi:hypothetical protein
MRWVGGAPAVEVELCGLAKVTIASTWSKPRPVALPSVAVPVKSAGR